MPKRKAAEEAADYSDEDEETVTKKKTDNKKAADYSDEDEETVTKKNTDNKKAAPRLDVQVVCQLSKNRKVVVRKFKGKVFVDIREFYPGNQPGLELPGKKGIALTLEQWDTLKEHINDIQELIKSLG